MGRVPVFPLEKIGSIPFRGVWIKGFPSSGIADGAVLLDPLLLLSAKSGAGSGL